MADLSTGNRLNTPDGWSLEDGRLKLATVERTDFWRRTHYGFVRDNCSFRQTPSPSAFTASIAFGSDHETLCNQAGHMLRIDQEIRIKCGIEHSDGTADFSIVATFGNSDRSVTGQPLASCPGTSD